MKNSIFFKLKLKKNILYIYSKYTIYLGFNMLNLDDIVKKYLTELKKVYLDFDKNFDKIKKAVDIAKIAHEWQFRKYSGKPFIAHPLRVAIMVASKCNDLSLILAAILHDTVEDSPKKVSMKSIYENFWDDVWYLVDSVTDNIMFYYKNPKKKFKNKTEKILCWSIKDARCGFLKLIDREHNNKTLIWLKTDKQIRKSFETQALYNPLREILRMDAEDFDVKDMDSLLSNYMKNNKIKNVDDLKSNLYNITFYDIDSNNFDLFYSSSDSIVWEINSKKMFEDLIKNDSFDNKIEIISLKQDVDWNFSCLFKYKGWQVFSDHFKVRISSFKY